MGAACSMRSLPVMEDDITTGWCYPGLPQAKLPAGRGDPSPVLSAAKASPVVLAPAPWSPLHRDAQHKRDKELKRPVRAQGRATKKRA